MENSENFTDQNSKYLEKEQIFLLLMQRKRIPQNDSEEQLMREIEEIENKGMVVEIPFNGL